MEMSFPGRYTGRIKCWWPPSCNDREESHIPRELARLLEQSLISCCTLCCPTQQNAQLHNKASSIRLGATEAQNQNTDCISTPTLSVPIPNHHTTEHSLTCRGRSLSSHTPLPTPPAGQRRGAAAAPWGHVAPKEGCPVTVPCISMLLKVPFICWQTSY